MVFSFVDFFPAGMFAVYFCLSIANILGEIFVMKKYSCLEELFEKSVFLHLLVLNFFLTIVGIVSRSCFIEEIVFYLLFGGILLNVNFLLVDFLPELLKKLIRKGF